MDNDVFVVAGNLLPRFIIFMNLKNIFCCLFVLLARQSLANLITYKAPVCNFNSSAYTVNVRDDGHSWQNTAVYQADVAEVINAKSVMRKTTFTYFDCDREVEVEISVNYTAVDQVKVRPASLGITPLIKGNRITLRMKPNQVISVEINGDIFRNIQIFANPPEAYKPSIKDTNVIYYGPGIHKIGKVQVPSNKTVYIAGGAIVQGNFVMDHVKNVRICGRGILTQFETGTEETKPGPAQQRAGTLRNDMLNVSFSTDVHIEGLIVMPHKYSVLIGQSARVTVRNFKSFSSEGNADGIDIFSSTDVTLDHIYMRNSDDCIAIYGHRWNYYGNTKNIIVNDAILWADVAHPILIGTHGDTPHPDTLENMKFSNIEILDQHENQIDYQGCMALNAGDSNFIRNISFHDVRVDDIRKGQLINLRVMFNHKYNTSPGAGIENVLFKNITYTGLRAGLSIISGYDEQRGIKNVTFENLNIGGKYITDTMEGKPGFYKTGDMANIYIGEHTEAIKFIRSANP
ncbi:MAG: glycosyl hydrolase family 28 protein [Bacteroidota bacterium]